MPKLNDTQLVLLSAALQREDCSIFPLPTVLADAGDRTTKAVTALIKYGFAEERETNDPASVHRTDQDVRYGVFVTEAGAAAIDSGPDAAERTPPAAAPDIAQHGKADPTPTRASKTASIIALLQRDGGATVPELITATGWLPHTTRAALTGLRKKGHAIERSKRDDATCYRILTAA
jgi:DNA-binding MarR family transcriptional regulator